MREHPILFSGPLVRAILDGRKSITRRLVNPQPVIGDGGCWYPEPPRQPAHAARHYASEIHLRKGLATDFCRYAVGVRLWARETWAAHWMYNDKPPCESRSGLDGDNIWYAADGDGALGSRGCEPSGRRGKWRPSIHMPRWASRITLEVTGVRVERLQDITGADARAEGVTDSCHNDIAIEHFAQLWNKINGERASWDSNPWVWVVVFKPVEALAAAVRP